ncbi:FecR domain-containing protein [Marinobacterium lutimaris]|uniref:FecR family protein n=1 Tax=Marinobacterium lutimaris TaxID=568106 RepID=A0A1H6DI63_9GAMM|nr:FecR domain-containing protein [Marinobacterium lutimaris]SEG84894.1 FecR family protein [Marinobacterium lutimaris]
MTASNQEPERIAIRQAARWLTELHDEGLDAAGEAELDRWRSACAENEAAWQKALHLQAQFERVPANIGHKTLNRRPDAGRRALLRSLAVAAVVLPSGYLGLTQEPWKEWLADYHTQVGEQRRVSLADGGFVLLNTDTRIDLASDRDKQLIRHYSGEILVQSSAELGSNASTPLRVATEQGELETRNARFLVKQEPDKDQARLAVLDGSVRVRSRSGRYQEINAGSTARLFAGQAYDLRPVGERQLDSWSQGVILASDMPLKQFLAELSRYRNGWLRCDPAVTDLRISGVFQLRDIEVILDGLPVTLPVRVNRRTDFWVTVAPA